MNNSEAFAHIPDKELYIFPSGMKTLPNVDIDIYWYPIVVVPPDDQQAPISPQGTIPQSYAFSLSSLNATQLSGGSVKIVDSTIFPISTTIAAAEVTVEPGAMR